MWTASRTLAVRITVAQLTGALALVALAWAATAVEGRELTRADVLSLVLPLAGTLGLCWGATTWRRDGALLASGASGARPATMYLVALLCATPWLSVEAPAAPTRGHVSTTQLTLRGSRGAVDVRWSQGVARRLDTGERHPTLPPPAPSLRNPRSIEASLLTWAPRLAAWCLCLGLALVAIWRGPEALHVAQGLPAGGLAFAAAQTAQWALARG